MGKGQSVKNQNVESLKVDQKFEKDQNVENAEVDQNGKNQNGKKSVESQNDFWCSDLL